jgi:hypothetical protein
MAMFLPSKYLQDTLNTPLIYLSNAIGKTPVIK